MGSRLDSGVDRFGELLRETFQPTEAGRRIRRLAAWFFCLGLLSYDRRFYSFTGGLQYEDNYLRIGHLYPWLGLWEAGSWVCVNAWLGLAIIQRMTDARWLRFVVDGVKVELIVMGVLLGAWYVFAIIT